MSVSSEWDAAENGPARQAMAKDIDKLIRLVRKEERTMNEVEGRKLLKQIRELKKKIFEKCP